jgi:hypothetical protein
MTRHAALALGILGLVAAPAAGAAQGRVGRTPAATTGVTLPSPPPGGGRGSPFRGHGPGRIRPIGGATFGIRGFGETWAYPVIVGPTYQVPAPAPAVVHIPYYYPVPAPAAPAAPAPERPAPPPYDPTQSRMVMIGAGEDGGAGVLRLVELAGDTLGITWLGTSRPIRSAALLVADADRRTLRTGMVDLERRDARFALATLERPAAYAGVTLVFADGATQTVLVPLPSRAR